MILVDIEEAIRGTKRAMADELKGATPEAVAQLAGAALIAEGLRQVAHELAEWREYGKEMKD